MLPQERQTQGKALLNVAGSSVLCKAAACFGKQGRHAVSVSQNESSGWEQCAPEAL